MKGTFAILVICLLIGNISYAQVGIDKTQPDSMSVLDLGSTDKGLLIPRMNTVTRLALSTKADANQNSMLVYDTDKNAFFYLMDKQWYALNGWSLQAEGNPDKIIRLNTDLAQRLGINATATGSTVLAVGGNTRIEGKLTTKGMTSNSSLNIDGDIHSTGNVSSTTTGTSFETPTYSSKSSAGKSGPVHPGTIIMWYGDISGKFSNGLGYGIMKGWALCNGQNGTPNLQNKFVAGAGPGSYYKGETGGEANVTLRVEHLPAHQHTLVADPHDHETAVLEYWNNETDNVEDDCKTGEDGPSDKIKQTDGAKSGVTFHPAGKGNSHNNLPPYYALYYLIKL
jgi:hypothetical protein